MAALGGLSLSAEFLLLLPPPKKRLKLIPRLRFFSSTGGGAGEGVLPLPPPPYPFAFSALLLLTLRSANGGLGFSVATGPVLACDLLTVGDRWLAVSVPGVVATVVVKLGLLVVLRALAAEGVEGASEAAWGWGEGGRRCGVAVRWMRTSEAGASLALLLLLLRLLLLLAWEMVGLELVLVVKDGLLEPGVGVIGSAVLTFPRFGGGLGEAFLERKERRRINRGLWLKC
jgi:hypothetical protein